MESHVDTRKRPRDESNDSLFGFNSKLLRLENSSDVNLNLDSPVASVSSDAKSIDSSGLISLQAQGIQEDLLKIFDDTDSSLDRESAVQDLDSVIKSFEKEIQVPVPVVQPELGYLLEASDDELGLPPAGEKGGIEEGNLSAQFSSSGSLKGIFLGLEDEFVPNYCWFENLRSEMKEWNPEGEEEVVALGGLFDHTDVAAELPYRSETMPCL